MFLDKGASQEGYSAYWAPFMAKALAERFVWGMLADLTRNFNEAAHHAAAERPYKGGGLGKQASGRSARLGQGAKQMKQT